jgi:hypothetical protein
VGVPQGDTAVLATESDPDIPSQKLPNQNGRSLKLVKKMTNES